jgi:hypothetical protein
VAASTRRAVIALSLAAALSASVTLVHAHAEAQSATLQMGASRTSMVVGDTLVLEVRAEITGGAVQLFEPPDLPGFDVLSREVSTPMSFRFGFGGQTQVMQSSSVMTLQLRALRPGRFDLKPARMMVGGRRFLSNRLEIVVVPSGQAPPPDPTQSGAPVLDPTQSGTTPPAPGDPTAPGAPPLAPPTGPLDGAQFDSDAFVRTVIDKPEPYIGEQVTVTIYLYVRGGIRNAPAASREPSAEGFWVHDLLPPQRTLEATEQAVGGTTYRVYVLRRFAAFPLHAGELSIGPMTVDLQTGTIFDLFGATPQRTMHREGVSMPVRVRELPAAGRPSGDVHVGRFTVEASLDRPQAATGDAVTLTARVRGTGNLRDVHVTIPTIEGLSILEPQIKDQIDAPSDLVGGVRTFEWLVVPRRPGAFTIPPLGIATLDPTTGAYARAESSAITLTAAGNATPIDPPETAPPSAGDAPVDDADPAAAYGPLRTDSALLRHVTPIHAQPWFPWALGGPPFLWLAVLLGSALRRRAAAKAGADAPRRAVKGARKRLSRAESLARSGDARGYYGEVTSALTAVLGARLGEPTGGFTLGKLRAHLIARGMPEELATRIVEELEGAEFARFSAAGASPEEMDRTSDRVQALIERIDRFVPVTTEGA